MKFTCELDITPEEVREVIGLPNMDNLVEKTQEQIKEVITPSVNIMDPFGIMKSFTKL